MKFTKLIWLIIFTVYFSTAHSAVIIVDDPGEVTPARLSEDHAKGLTCRLRDAIIAAGKNINVSGCTAGDINAVDEIILAVDEPIQLMSQIAIFSSVRIQSAEGFGRVQIIGNPEEFGGPVFYFGNPVGEFHLDNVRITGGDNRPFKGGAISFGGSAPTLNAHAKGLDSYQVISITNSVFENNQATEGGAIFFDRTLANLITIENNVFRNNHVTISGGAISGLEVTGQAAGFNGGIPSFNLLISNNHFESNTSEQLGGAMALFNSSEGILITENVFINNSSNGDAGAAALYGFNDERFYQTSESESYIKSLSSNRVISQYYLLNGNSFISNQTANSGGAMLQSNAEVDLINNTFSGNQASSGGAIGAYLGIMGLTHNTFADNSGTENSDHFFISEITAALNHNVFVRAVNDDACGQSQSVIGEANFNAIDDQSCQPLNQPLTDTLYGSALLANLQTVNGLPAFRPAPDSPIIDYINQAECIDSNQKPLPDDQWGRPRPTDGNGDGLTACDIGAVEALSANDLIWFDGF